MSDRPATPSDTAAERRTPLPSATNSTVPGGAPAPGAVTAAVKVTPWPDTEGFGKEVTPVVVLALTTTCPPSREPALGVKLYTPRKVAVIVWVPRARALVVTEATPPPSRPCGPPMLVPSAWNCTVPVGVPAPGAVAVTVAVNVTP